MNLVTPRQTARRRGLKQVIVWRWWRTSECSTREFASNTASSPIRAFGSTDYLFGNGREFQRPKSSISASPLLVPARITRGFLEKRGALEILQSRSILEWAHGFAIDSKIEQIGLPGSFRFQRGASQNRLEHILKFWMCSSNRISFTRRLVRVAPVAFHRHLCGQGRCCSPPTAPSRCG
jgi:hypothetical protein